MKEYPDNIPWGEIFKAAIPFLVVLVVFFTVLSAVNAQSNSWMIGGAK